MTVPVQCALHATRNSKLSIINLHVYRKMIVLKIPGTSGYFVLVLSVATIMVNDAGVAATTRHGGPYIRSSELTK